MIFRALMVCAAALCPIAAMSAESAIPEGVWIGKGQVGLVLSQGNAESKNANAAVDLSRVDGPWKHAFHIGGLYGQSGEVTSAQRWDTAWQTNHDLSSDLFAFGAFRYAADRFSGFQYQATLSAGLGYKLINTEPTTLNAQLGVGYRRSRPELIVKDTSGEVVSRTPLDTTSEAIATAGVDYMHVLTSTTTISDKFLIEYGSSNTLLTDTFALTVKMSDALALSVGLGVQRNSNPPAGLKKTDTVETVNLVFAF
jgi:putative salt-induced outer membrane protein